jgi:O-antigen/teichoic acid export membrane protein
MGYTKTAFSGLSWVGLLRIFLRLSAFIRTAILARLLSPAQFGVFGIAAIILGFLEMLTETGINVFLIQEDDNSLKKYLNTAYVVSILRGLFIAALVFASAPFIVQFFSSPESYNLIVTITLVPLIRGFINPAIVIFQKNMLFKADFAFRSGIVLTETVIAIALTVLMASPMGLVYSLIGSALVEVILSHLIVSPKPQLRFEWSQVVDIIRQGKWITGARYICIFIEQNSRYSYRRLILILQHLDTFKCLFAFQHYL